MAQQAGRHRERGAARRFVGPVDDTRASGSAHCAAAPALRLRHVAAAIRRSAAASVAAGNGRHARERRRRAGEPVDGAQADAGLHARGQAFEQRLARQRGRFGLGRRAGQEAGQRRRQHVQAARADRDLRAGAQRQVAPLGLRARDFEARLAVAAHGPNNCAAQGSSSRRTRRRSSAPVNTISSTAPRAM